MEEQVEEGGQPEVAGREGGPPSVATPPPNEEEMPADDEDDDDDDSKPRGVSRRAQDSLDVDTGHMHDLGPSWSCGNHENLHHLPMEFRCEVPMSVCLVCCTCYSVYIPNFQYLRASARSSLMPLFPVQPLS